MPHSQPGRYGDKSNPDSLAARPIEELLRFKVTIVLEVVGEVLVALVVVVVVVVVGGGGGGGGEDTSINRGICNCSCSCSAGTCEYGDELSGSIK